MSNKYAAALHHLVFGETGVTIASPTNNSNANSGDGQSNSSSDSSDDQLNGSNETYYLVEAVATQIVIGLVMSVVMHILLYRQVGLTSGTLYTGFAAWIMILLFTPACNAWFVMVPPNHGAVFADQWRRLEKTTGNNLQHTFTLREVGPGLQGKRFWEVLVDNEFINLQKRIPMGKALRVTTSDNIPYDIEFSVFGSPMRGFLCNHVRIFGEETPKYFQDLFSGYLLHTISSMDRKTLLSNIGVDPDRIAESHPSRHFGKLGTGFNQLLGGKDKNSPTEIQFGWHTGDPLITSIRIAPEFEKLMATKRAMEIVQEGVNGLKDSNGHPDLKLMVATGAAGVETNSAFVSYAGLENAEHVNIMGAVGGSGSNKSKK